MVIIAVYFGSSELSGENENWWSPRARDDGVRAGVDRDGHAELAAADLGAVELDGGGVGALAAGDGELGDAALELFDAVGHLFEQAAPAALLSSAAWLAATR